MVPARPSRPTPRLRHAILRGQVLAALCQSFPGFSTREVEAVYVSRDAAAEPVPLSGKLRRAIPSRIGGRVFLCTPAAAPPRRANWDGEVMFARETASAVAARCA